ncbi:TraB/GumN family protein [Chelatococcus sambhunathii]|uniref:TraB/GumN family protein n=2 Tax=Chelatococcus sambhunathii TaxID=363953 RepID=A0ABU1DKK9_9HYPH|nr:TraB/GumN family protein [Chelatococcus sambhunathii]
MAEETVERRGIARLRARAVGALAVAALLLAPFPGSVNAGEARASQSAGETPAAPAAQPGSWRVDDTARAPERTQEQTQAPPVMRAADCVGVDLVKALQTRDAANFERFESSARAVLNGQGLLWRVEGKGSRPSYLFGTMHSSEAIAKSFDDLVMRALQRSRIVATELPGASTRKVAAELRRLVAARSFRPGGNSLDALPEPLRDEVEAKLSDAGVPPQVAEQLQPWYLALTLSRSNCAGPAAGARAGVDTETADARIERLAVEKGAALVALESPVEQVDALASIPDEVALRMMREATETGLRPADIESTITGLYSTRRIGYLLAMRGPIWAGVFDVDGYADFISAFITRRNVTMIQRALPILQGGEAFIAVGALHLPGDAGMIELLRRQGFSVTRIW